MSYEPFKQPLDISQINDDWASKVSLQHLSEIKDSLNILDSQFLNEDSIQQLIIENIIKSSLTRKLLSIRKYIEDSQTITPIFSFLKQKYMNLIKFVLCHPSVSLKDYQLLFQIFYAYVKHLNRAQLKEGFIKAVKMSIQSIRAKMQIDKMQSLKVKVMFQMIEIKQLHCEQKQFLIQIVQEKANLSLITHLQNFIEDLSKKVKIDCKITLKEYKSHLSKLNKNQRLNESKITNQIAVQKDQIKNTLIIESNADKLILNQLKQDSSLFEMLQYLEGTKNVSKNSRQLVKKIQGKSLIDFLNFQAREKLILLLLKTSLSYKQLLRKSISFGLYILTIQDFIFNLKILLDHHHQKPLPPSTIKIIKDELSRNLQNSSFILTKLGFI